MHYSIRTAPVVRVVLLRTMSRHDPLQRMILEGREPRVSARYALEYTTPVAETVYGSSSGGEVTAGPSPAAVDPVVGFGCGTFWVVDKVGKDISLVAVRGGLCWRWCA